MNSFVAILSKADFAGNVVTPEHPDYDQLRRVWNGSFSRYPAAIIQALEIEDVRKAIQLAASQAVPLAIRCGGHSIPGFSTCDDGIVLDLSLLNGISVEPDAEIANVGGGALLGQLDAAGAPYGLVTPAGVISHTGVAGLTLGGGMGWLSRKLGLTIDSLIGARIVTARGDVIDCSADSEPELFWGLRGGGGNFGVVTDFQFRMHHLGQICVGNWTYPFVAATVALKAYRDLASAAPRELTSSFTLSSSGLSMTAFASGASANGLGAILPYGHLVPDGSGGTLNLSYCNFQSRNDDAVCWGRRYYSRGGFLRDLDDAAISLMVQSAAQSPTADSKIYVLQLGGAVRDVPEDATAYSGRAAAFYWIANPVWDDVADDVRCLDWGRNSARQLAALSLDANYVNEQGDSGSEIARKAYGAAKYRRLSALKARFDRNNLFRLNQNIAPAD